MMSRGLPCRTVPVPVLGPVESLTPSRRTPDPSQEPVGRSGPPDPLRPAGTITLPCDRCEGGSRPPADGKACPVCAGRDEVAFTWRVSGYDDQAHAFVEPAEASDMRTAPRPCWHSVPVSKMTDDVGAARRCPACVAAVAVAEYEQVDTGSAAKLADMQRGLQDLPDGRDLLGPFGSGTNARPHETAAARPTPTTPKESGVSDNNNSGGPIFSQDEPEPLYPTSGEQASTDEETSDGSEQTD